MGRKIDWSKLSGAVRVARAIRKIDQKDAAKEMQITASTLSRLENGKTVTADSFMIICAWLRRDPAYFLRRPTKDTK